VLRSGDLDTTVPPYEPEAPGKGYVDSGRATANALAGALGSYLLDAAATRTAKGDGHSWPVVFGEECPKMW
jgi:hypothetical protein